MTHDDASHPGTTTPRIVEIGPDDWRSWRQLRLRSLSEDPQAFASSTARWTGDLDSEARWRDRLAAPGACFVAFDASTPVGMAGATPGDDGSVQLVSMWVVPAARGRGIGSALVSAVIEWVREAAAGPAIGLRVMDGNQAASWLYQRSGFGFVTDAVDAEGCRAMTFEER